MDEASCEVVFRGKILSGRDPERVKAELARVLSLDAAAIDALFVSPKTVLGSGLSRSAAQALRERLMDAGIMVAVMSGSAQASVSAQPASTSVTAATGETAAAAPGAPMELSLSEAGTPLGEAHAFEAPTVKLRGLRITKASEHGRAEPVPEAPRIRELEADVEAGAGEQKERSEFVRLLLKERR